MPDKFRLAQRRLREAEERMEALRDARLMASLQGRFHLMGTLEVLLDQATRRRQSAQEEVDRHRVNGPSPEALG